MGAMTTFTRMDESTAEEWAVIGAEHAKNWGRVADPEVVVASLCHDIGKAVSVPNHPAIAAEILKPYVRDEVYWMILAHQDFQGRHYYNYFGKDPDARDRYRGAEWFSLAERFADDWDQTSFDP